MNIGYINRLLLIKDINAGTRKKMLGEKILFIKGYWSRYDRNKMENEKFFRAILVAPILFVFSF